MSERNPHLPEPPADGKHNLEGATRCRYCGAYSGSAEGQAECKGEWAESSKMRSWAAREWARDLLIEEGIIRSVALFVFERRPPMRVGGVSYRSETETLAVLECGHRANLSMPERPSDEEIDRYLLYKRMIEDDELLFVGCVDCEGRLKGTRSGDRQHTDLERQRAEIIAVVKQTPPWELDGP